MTRKAGGPADDSAPPRPPAVVGLANLFPGDRTFVACKICREEFTEIERHLVSDHPNVTMEIYKATFPDAPLKGDVPTEVPSDPRISVSAAEADKHPGGREAVMIQKGLALAERRGYQDDVAGLIAQGFPKGHLVATTAYLMVLDRRARSEIEQTRQNSKSVVFAGQSFDLMQKLAGLISSNMKLLEIMRSNRVDTGDSPMKIIDREMAEAELFLQQHIGELVESCPHCAQLLTPPALPHWAYARIETPNGVEFPVWSKELWRLVLARTIPVWVMAFALRTSPEGLRVTAERRKETWPTTIVLEAEERALRAVIEARDTEIMVAANAPAAASRVREEEGEPLSDVDDSTQ